LDVRTEGTARGIVAIGPRAVGVIAFGNVAAGLFAFGNVAVGMLAFGAVALAGSVAVGGLSLAPLGIAAGLAAVGRVACGIIAGGGLAIGWEIPWAIEQVSFLNDNGSYFLQHFLTSAKDPALLIIAAWIFTVFPFLNGIMCVIKRDEYRRIKKADPDIDVSVTWP
jgi:hypothetical protein